ncbi:MAG: cohesin domain-containing protein [Candidatus Shapirobacteria bacterium]|nr:cohesin domain-containing protein [Candidatus Shapirobacteria bacterium]
MKKTAWLINSVLIFLVLMASGAKAVSASPHLFVSPSSGSHSVDDDFSVTLSVDSGSEVVGGVDAIGTYDSARLELTSANKASSMVFDSTDSGGACSIDTGTAGKFSITCYSNDALTDKAVNGQLVVLNFRAKATGTATLGFTCASGSTTDSNIVKSSNSADVIVCGENVGGSYTIDDSDGGSDDEDDEETTTTTTKTLPKSGNVGMTLGLLAFGAISVLSAVFLKFL